MELNDAFTYIKEILTVINSSNSSKIRQLRDITTLRVYLQCLIRILHERQAGKNIDATITVGDTKEDAKKISLLDDSSFVLHKIINAFLPYLNDELIKDYHTTTDIFLNHKLATYPLKIQLLTVEEQLLTQRIQLHLKLLNLKLGFYEIRYKIVVEGLAEGNRSHLNHNDSIIENVLEEYLSNITSEFVLKGEILQLDVYLKTLLDNSDFPLIQRIIFRNMISHSIHFHLYSTNELLLFLDDHEDIFTNEEIEEFRHKITYIPTGIDFRTFIIENGKLSRAVTLNKDLETVINFSIPHRYLASEANNFKLGPIGNYEIEVHRVSSVYQDPMFHQMHSYEIGGIGWHHFCDLQPNHNEDYCHIVIIIQGLFAPHVNLTDSGAEDIDFSEKSALMTTEYCPYKEYIIKKLRENFSFLSPYIEWKINDIKLDLFSNYSIRIIDKSNLSILNQRVYALTNPNSFSQSAGRFIEQLNSLNMSSSLINIRELLSSTIIKSEKNLAEFVYRLFDLVIKNSIELHGHYESMWKDKNTPKLEPQIQPIIVNLIRHIFNYMGISIEREPKAATGQLDFLVSKTIDNNVLVKVPVELKLARYPDISNIEDGINAQLPIYMKALNCNYGVFIVLWFKNNEFNYPNKYNSIAELDTHIKNIKSNNRIMDMIIDCTKPTNPSKLKSVM